jgi:hypothetical protein
LTRQPRRRIMRATITTLCVFTAAVVIGAALVLQGSMTLWLLIRRGPLSTPASA